MTEASRRRRLARARRAPSGTRRRALSSLVSYTGVQGLIAVSAFVRIPLLLHSLGRASFGLVNVIGGVAPLLLAGSQGLRTASRTLAAEEIGCLGDLTAGTWVALRRAARRSAVWQLAVTTPVIVLLPLASMLRAGDVVGHRELTLTFVVSAGLCALAGPGAMRWGILEARGRTSLVNSFFAAMTVAGLLVTVAAAPFVHSLFLFGTLNVATSALPFWLPLLVPSERARRAGSADRGQPISGTARRSVRRAALIGGARSGSPFASRALDPFVISAAIGPAGAAGYVVAQRLSVVGTLVPVAVLPFVSGVIARRRGAGTTVRLRGALKLAGVYLAVAAPCGAALVLAGPRLGRVLTGGQLDVGRGLFVALAALGCISSVELALESVGTGPLAMRFGLVVDLTTAAVNVALSLLLVRSLGLAGPVWASVIAVGLAGAAWLAVLVLRPALLAELHDSTRAADATAVRVA